MVLLQVLAGAQVNALTTHKQTSLHLAASKDLAVICSVLLQNGVDCCALDDSLCNGIHLPCYVILETKRIYFHINSSM